MNEDGSEDAFVFMMATSLLMFYICYLFILFFKP